MPKFWGSINIACSIFSRSDSEDAFVENPKCWQWPKSKSVERVNLSILQVLEQKLSILLKHQRPSFSYIFDIIFRICCKLKFLRCQQICGLFPTCINDQHFETFSSNITWKRFGCTNKLCYRVVSFLETFFSKVKHSKRIRHMFPCDDCQRQITSL